MRVLDDPVRIGPFAAAGHAFVIDCNDADFAARLTAQLHDLRAAAGPVAERGGGHLTVFLVVRREPAWQSHPWEVWRDGEPCELLLTRDYVGPYVVWEIVRLVLEGAHPLIPVHAAAVARHGQALVLAGSSHSGKSTLAGWLTAHGWDFLTDEVALLEHRRDGTVAVHPFWRPIGVRRPGPLDAYIEAPADEEEVLLPASQLGNLGTVTPLRAIVFPHYEPGSRPAIEPWARAAAVRELADHLPTLGSSGTMVFDAIVSVVRSVPSFSLAVDDLDAASAVLDDLVRTG